MKKVQFEPELTAHEALLKIAQAATPMLEEEIGEPAARVEAKWGYREHRPGYPLIRLQISDPFGEASGEFSLDELQPPERARRRFYRLWGDLLQGVARRQVEVLQTIGADRADQ